MSGKNIKKMTKFIEGFANIWFQSAKKQLNFYRLL